MNGLKKEISDFIARIIQSRSRDEGKSLDFENDIHLMGPTGILDSIEFLNLMVAVEERFKIEIDFTDYEPSEFTTLNGFVQCALESTTLSPNPSIFKSEQNQKK